MNQKYNQTFHDASTGKLIMSLIIILCYPFCSYGQSGGAFNPIKTEPLFKNQMVNTPATAALKQNIVYPVNYSTGLPEIRIPLYEIKSGDVTLPIYLTYHASGIKLSEAAGWAGLGWDLVAEPMITRTIRGLIDDTQTMACKFDKYASVDRFPSYVENLSKYSKEEPDEYYYRLLTKQGMFMYSMEPSDKSREFLPIPYENIRIDWTGKFFRITDDDGTIYKFNGGRESGNGTANPIGWKASAIIAPNMKDSVSFVYYENKVQYMVKMHDDYIIVRDRFSIKKGIKTNRREELTMAEYLPDECMQDPIVIGRTNDILYGYQCDNNGEIISDGTIPDRSISGHYVDSQSQQLSEINFGQGKIIFEKDPQFPRLKKITVYNNNKTLIKEFIFNYYTPNERVNQRYFLTSIIIKDKEGESTETYNFGYESPEKLPVPGNRSIDYWGYYNGITRPDNESLVPQQTINVTRWKYRYSSNGQVIGIESAPDINMTFGSKLSRGANEEYMKYGTLTSITYPAGSTDEFVYQSHRYKDNDNSIKQAGGLRIKQITSKDKNGEMKTRTFSYGRNEDGCGTPLTTHILDYFRLVQGLFLGEVFDGFWQNNEFHYSPIANENCYARQRTFFCNPTRPITFDGGSTVMYEYVTEYNGTPNNNSGKTVYQYKIDSTHSSPDDTNAMQCNSHLGWMYGNLTHETVYRNDNGQYVPLEESEYYYSTHDKNFGKILVGEASANNVIRTSTFNGTPDIIKSGYSYIRTEVFVGCKLLKWSKHKIFNDEATVYTGTNYEYSDPTTTNLTDITESGSDGKEYVTRFMYPQDYGKVLPYTEMVARNMLSSVIKKEYTRNGEYIGIETPYFQSSENIYKPGSLIVKRSTTDTSDIRASYLYDSYGKLRQESRDEKESVVYLYGYNNQYVVAKIENTTYQEVEAKLGREEIEKLASEKDLQSYYSSKLNNLRISLPGSRVTTYTYKPLVGIASITNPLGVSTYYDYDGLGRLINKYFINNNKKKMIESYDYHYAE